MQVPVKWLSEYVDIDGITTELLEERLIMTGSNTEYVKKTLGKAEGLVMGRITAIEKHPDADKLVVCKVEAGSDTLQIVTGASNVQVGKNIAVAVHGSRTGDGTKIKNGKLRGVESNGMLCSLEEMDFDDKVIPKLYTDGIFLFGESYETGKPLIQSFPELEDDVILFEITPNRPDCLSVTGIAREVAASFDRKMKPFDASIRKLKSPDINDHVDISIECPDLCPRYMGRIVRNVKIGESPDWMKFRLMKAGMRPVNNIVDISNYVMLELGQPTHAFDLDKLSEKKIKVRESFDDEVIKTLDGVERSLPKHSIVIADGERAIAIGGIMGGEDTEVKDDTSSILIEAANFEKANIRRTSAKTGLRSEASSRFEKGINPELAQVAIDRVCQLIESMGAGDIVDAKTDVYPNKYISHTIEVSVNWVNNYIGIDISSYDMKKMLEGLFFDVQISEDSDILAVKAPYFRTDIQQPIDLVEEIARIYGYDKIPVTIPSGKNSGGKTKSQMLEDRIRTCLISQGMYETLTYSFVSPKSLDDIRVDSESKLRNHVKLLNPLGDEYSVMRTSLFPNALQILSRNLKYKSESTKIFEIGNVFFKQDDGVDGVREYKRLAISSYGKEESFFTLKGDIENLFKALGISGTHFYSNTENPSFHPGRCADIFIGKDLVGYAGEVHPLVCENYDLSERCYAGELDFDRLIEESSVIRQFTHLPRFPAVTRDIALIVDDDITHEQMMKFITKNGGRELVDVKLFDVYKGKQIEEGKKSMAYALVYRREDRTLTDDEINIQFDNLVDKLSILGATLR